MEGAPPTQQIQYVIAQPTPVKKGLPIKKIIAAIVIVVFIILIGLFIYWIMDGDILDGQLPFTDNILVNPPKPLACPSNMNSDGALLCYPKCPSGYKWDKVLFPTLCFGEKPANYPGTETHTHLQHHRIYSTVGLDGGKKECDAGYTQHDGLCYQIPAGYKYESPGFLGRISCPPGSVNTGGWCYYDRGVGRIPNKAPCPAGMRDDGTSCWSDAHIYGKGCCCIGGSCCGNCPPGYNDDGCTCRKTDVGIKVNLFQRHRCNADEDLIDGLCYKKGKPGFNCIATACNMPRLQSQIGKIPQNCPSNKEKHGLLCYPKCNPGYKRSAGDLEFCQSNCPPGFKDIGIGGCEKPTHGIGAGKGLLEVGVCPPDAPIKSGDFCKKDMSVKGLLGLK